MEQLIIKFNSIVTLFKKKTYDFLDQRKTDFNNDYDEFKDSIQELHVKSFKTLFALFIFIKSLILLISPRNQLFCLWTPNLIKFMTHTVQ